MTDLRLDLLKREHPRLAAKPRLVLRVVDLGVACRNDEDHAVIRAERQRFCDACRFAVGGFGGQLYGRAGHREFDHAILCAELTQIRFCFFDGHGSQSPSVCCGISSIMLSHSRRK